MPDISLVIDGENQTVPAGTTGTTWFEKSRDVVAIKVDGTPRDLATPFEEGTSVEAITLASEDGLNILRHSATHVLAPGRSGRLPRRQPRHRPVHHRRLLLRLRQHRRGHPRAAARPRKAHEAHHQGRPALRAPRNLRGGGHPRAAAQPYKLELVTTKGKGAEGASVEVGGATLTMYDNVRRDGSVAWKDLCRGPHLPSTKLIGNGFALTKASAAYWKGDQSNDQLQRIYGTAWASKEDLVAYQERIKEAERRDHRRLGAELDLYSFPEEIGPGLVIFHPKGGILRHEIESYVTDRHKQAGFDFVHTPEISKGGLFHTSGHLPYYADTMFPPMLVDEERDEEGNVTKAGQEYYLKAMNCPMHNLIFRSRGRSYRELPLRFYELGHDYRYEKSGVVHGLTRMRGFTQDDSHTYCTPEQASEEIRSQIEFFLSILSAFGLKDFYLELSTRDEDGKKKDKFIGSDEDWAAATKALEDACAATGLDLVPDPGGAAFYGPKVSVQVKDAIGPYLADVDDPVRLQPARALRPGVHGRRRHSSAPRHDPLREAGLRRALHRRPHRALRGRVPGVALARPGPPHPRRRGLRRLRQGRCRQAARARRTRRDRPVG